ncbi:unnamed protein product [Rotaria sp. Silwood2]|nr:unnamed protein product [Rotaria sp. Silwood2]
MGCDGGTIPKRDELVRQKKKAEVKDKNAANMAKWRHCTLKHDTLKRPIVVDSHGLLYNKDAILEYLLDRMQFEHGPSYIKKMKDIKELQLTENSAFKSNHNDLGNEYLDVYSSPFICPLTGLEMNGKYKFCAIWTCGCVLSDRALRSVNNHTANEKLSCPKCGQEYSSNDDVIILNPENEDIILMEERRQRLNTSQKKNGSTKRKLPEIEEDTNEKKIKIDSTANADVPSSSSTINKKVSTSKVNTSKIVSTNKSTSEKSSIQQDSTKSDLYKSLFTTSDAAKEKEKNKAHWITYNPLYF